MKFQRLVGQEEAKNLLSSFVERSIFPSALRLEGPPGVGKALGVWEWIQGVFCESSSPPCGSCKSCRAVRALSHPDFLIVTPDNPERFPGQSSLRPFPYNPNNDVISIHAIRKLREGGGPVRAPVRMVVLMDADEMTPEAQNAFLKTLEEPPDQTVFVLITSRPHLLLPTIRSRSVEIAFRPLSPTDFEKALPESYAHGKVLYEASGGSPGLAREIASLGILQERRKFLALLEGNSHVFLSFLLQESFRWKPRELWLRFLIWGQMIEDAWLVLHQNPPKVHGDLFTENEPHLAVHPHHLMQALERLPFVDRVMTRNLPSLDTVISFIEPLIPEHFLSTLERLRYTLPDDGRGVIGW